MEESNLIDPPEGWRKVVKRRQSGKTAGKFDIYYYSPKGDKIRSYIQLDDYLRKSGSTLSINEFNFSTTKESSEIDTAPPLISKLRGKTKKTLGLKKVKKASRKYFNDESSSLPSDQSDIQYRTETFVTSSTSTSRRAIGRRVESEMSPQKYFKKADSSTPSHQFSNQNSKEALKTDTSSSFTRKRGRPRKKRFQFKKAPPKNFNDKSCNLPSDESIIDLTKESDETNTSPSSADKRSSSPPLVALSSKVNEDSNMESLERYSDTLSFLIPIDQLQDLDEVSEPVFFPKIKNCPRTFLATNGS